jgi:hypothetical protein
MIVVAVTVTSVVRGVARVTHKGSEGPQRSPKMLQLGAPVLASLAARCGIDGRQDGGPKGHSFGGLLDLLVLAPYMRRHNLASWCNCSSIK